jgi:serine/threonine-protein kinase RsbW
VNADSSPELSAQLVLSSRFESIEVAERALVDLCKQARCGADDEYWIVTALREAIANAVRHGNKQDPNLKVKVRYRIANQTVEISVEDEGEGFDLEAIPDPTNAENLLRPSGRGVFYMRQFMNHVEFGRTANGGTSVRMVRELSPNDKE